MNEHIDLDLDVELDLSLTRSEAEQIVKAHGYETRIDPETGTLMGGIVCWFLHKREAFIDWSPVPLDVDSLRNWLGY